jgi:hypothetical protein
MKANLTALVALRSSREIQYTTKAIQRNSNVLAAHIRLSISS